MPQKMFQVDAFAREVFKGNPAAVMVLDEFLPDALMQSIAAENNLAETAFVVPRAEPGHYDLRWFTPAMEIDFCGHATLASAHILATELGHKPPFHFHVIVGDLIVDKDGELYRMDAPITPLAPIEVTPAVTAAFKGKICEAFIAAKNLMLVFDNPDDIRRADPVMAEIIPLSEDGIIITARDDHYDCISRYFAPVAGIPEDPVTGSAHAALGPYWAAKMEKSELTAFQASPRGGKLYLDVGKDRLTISGYAVTFMRGEIEL